jgi:hypothetical protein
MKKRILVLLIAGYFGVGCGDSNNSPIDTKTACSKVMKYCPDGYGWRAYVADEKDCQNVFNCVADWYSGHCRDLLAEGAECLKALTGSSGCGECNDIVDEIESSCKYPDQCM